MQVRDLPSSASLDPAASDPSAMSDPSSPIHHSSSSPENKNPPYVENNSKDEHFEENNSVKNKGNGTSAASALVKRERPSRACTKRAAARMRAAAEAEAAMAEAERRRKQVKRRERLAARLLKEESEDDEEEEGRVNEENGEEDEGSNSPSFSSLQCSKIVTPLVGEPEPSQMPRWNIRSMWQLASILNFLHVFRPLLNIKVEFSAEELETALISPNNTLVDVHMPLLKAIPPVARMALGHGTWVTVLCRKLMNWWHWVAEGDLPIVASRGTETEAYKELSPQVRVVILKALCDIRVEQEDIRNYIDDSIKRGIQLSLFRKERIGGDSHGISYWYEDDPIIGHRLYREITKVEAKKGKGKNVPQIPHSSYQWEAVATNLDEFQNVSEKLFCSNNRTEVSVGKKLKNNMLPEIEKVHKMKEKLLKKQHRQALMLDSMINSMDGFAAAGRSLRDRKPVTYTFDDYDRSISEAINVTKKKQPSPDPFGRSDPLEKVEASTNGKLGGGPSRQSARHMSFSAPSPDSLEDDEFQGYQNTVTLDRSNRQRHRSQRYSINEFVEALSDNEANSDSDNDIVGEVVYDDEYLNKRKQKRKMSSSSEGDEEYHWDQENNEEEDEEEEEDESLSTSEESDAPARRRFKILTGRTRRETKSRSVDELQSGLRRSKRESRNLINYRQYEMSESETESMKHGKSNSNALDDQYNASDDHEEVSMGSQDSENTNEQDSQNIDKQDIHVDPPTEEQHTEMVDKREETPEQSLATTDQDEEVGVKKRRFLDLNELAPGSGFDDGPNSTRDDDNTDDF